MTDELAPRPEGAMSVGALDINPALEKAAELGTGGVEVVERLHALHKDAQAMAAKTAFVRSMASLRAEMPHVEKTVAGQHGIRNEGTRTRGMYAPLDTIAKVCDPFISKHGFSYRFTREVVAGRDHDYVVCVVTHREGHEERTLYPAPAGDTNRGTNALQAVAVGESYAKRYALIAAFGITTADPDTDGNVQGQHPGEAVSDEQTLEIESLLAQLDDAVAARFMDWLGVERVADIPARRFAESVAMLRKKVKASQA